MKRIRFTTLRGSRNYGAGLLTAVFLAAGGIFFEAEAQSKKLSSVPKSPVKEKSEGSPKSQKPPVGQRPPASDDLYEGPGVGEPPAVTPKKPAPPSAAPAASPTSPIEPAAAKPYASKYADAWPSEYRPVPEDLLPGQAEENKAAAIAAFAEAEGHAERGSSDKALRAYQKAAALDPADARLAVRVARELLKTNDPTSAIQVLKDSIAAAPKVPTAHLYLARIYADHLQKPDLARQFAEKALELAPDDFQPWKAMLDFAAADTSGKKVAELIERAMKSPSRDADFWLDFAGFLRKDCGLENRKTPSDAEKKRIESVYQKALEIAPESASAIAQYGDYFALLRDHKKAIAKYEQALELKQPATHPALENLREKLATTLVADGRRADALPLLERLVNENPGRNDLGMMLAEVYDQTGQTDKALEYYQRSLALDLSKPDNHVQLALTLIKAKHYDRAIVVLQSAREKFPDRPLVTFWLARTYSFAKKHQMALDTFEAAQKEIKGRHEELATEDFYFSYGAAAEQAGKFEKAAELLKKCIEIKPDEPQGYNYLGYMWADRGEQLEEAGKLIQKAVELDPENAAYLDSLGWWYFKTGKFEDAQKHLTRAVELMAAAGEEDATVLDHLADTMEKLGKKDEALKLWKKAVKLESDIREKIEKKITDAEKK